LCHMAGTCGPRLHVGHHLPSVQHRLEQPRPNLLRRRNLRRQRVAQGQQRLDLGDAVLSDCPMLAAPLLAKITVYW